MRATGWSAPFALLAAMILGCGGSTNDIETCFGVALTYSGTRTGTAYVRVDGANAKTSLMHGGPFPSIQAAIVTYTNAQICSTYYSNPSDIPLTADAWIDAGGTETSICSDVQSPQCQPSSSDPQAHQTAMLRVGQPTTIKLDVVDPG